MGGIRRGDERRERGVHHKMDGKLTMLRLAGWLCGNPPCGPQPAVPLNLDQKLAMKRRRARSGSQGRSPRLLVDRPFQRCSRSLAPVGYLQTGHVNRLSSPESNSVNWHIGRWRTGPGLTHAGSLAPLERAQIRSLASLLPEDNLNLPHFCVLPARPHASPRASSMCSYSSVTTPQYYWPRSVPPARRRRLTIDGGSGVPWQTLRSFGGRSRSADRG